MQKPRARSPSTYLTRRRWTEEEARQVLVAWEESGLELTAFALGEGLDPQRLTRWRRRLVATAAPRFEEIVSRVIATTIVSGTAAEVVGERFEVVLPSGRVVRVPESFDASALRRLLLVVDEVRAC
jgi:hypothetical protein